MGWFRNSFAYAIIARFLSDNGHSGTLETFRAECADIFEDTVDGRIMPTIDEGVPLLAILEEYLLESLKRTPKAQEEQQHRDADAELIRADLPKRPLPQLAHTLDGIHTANILCVDVHSTYPTTLLPSLQLDASTIEVVLTGSTDKSLRLTRLDTGSLILSCPAPTKSPILTAKFHPVLPWILAASCMDGTHHLLDVRSADWCRSWSDHTKYVTRLAFSPDGVWMATGSHDRSVRIYKVAPAAVTDSDDDAMAPVPDYVLTHTAHFDTAVEGLAMLQRPGKPDANNRSPAPFLLVTAREDHMLHLIELNDEPGFSEDACSDPFRHTTHNMNPTGDNWVSFTAMDVQPSPSGRHILIHTDSSAGRLMLYRTPTPDVLRSAETKHRLSHVRNLYGVVADAFSRPRCAWDGDGVRVAATSDDGSVHVFEAASGRGVGRLEGHRGLVRDLVRRGNGGFVSCSFDKSVRVWE